MVAIIITVVLFLIVHLGAAIWFASRVNTQVCNITETLQRMENDIRALLVYDGKIKVIEERMNQSAGDRTQLWTAVESVRLEVANVLRDLAQQARK